ncbi:tetratricopeptide repeat protein [Aquimarina sp. LLG6339-5]|uniref:tetratricopeptide repeat protein n=1 Tax=Aquimarina sp. LLG6339-5 TaxID=3160830 RepID=UPI0038636063
MKRFTLILVCTISTCFFGYSCFWDYDTIEMERMQFPDVIELISGKFLRHSPEFYQWRIQDRKEKLEKSPDNLELYDDLAVAYSKIGNDAKAIQIILKKDSIAPNNYKTYANLGTFYIHNGQLEKGIEFIDKAIAINLDAHFGREIYQRYLVEYIMSKTKNGKIALPLSVDLSPNFDRFPRYKSDNFYTFLTDKYSAKTGIPLENSVFPEEELHKAIKGVMGMMKFGNHDSPILLETLADLLIANAWKKGARQLAARAYFKASYHSKQPETKSIYKQKVAFALYHQYTKKGGKRFTVQELEELLKQEITEGNDFFQRIRSDEIKWIQLGQNPEEEFSKKYYQEPSLGVRIQETNTSIDIVENKYQIYKPDEGINLESSSKDTIFLKDNLETETDTTQVKEQKKTDDNRSTIPILVFLLIPVFIIILVYAIKVRGIKF